MTSELDRNAVTDRRLASTFWTIWLAILVSIMIYPFFLGGGLPHGQDSDRPVSIVLWIVAIGSLAVASFLRWIYIPRQQVGRLLMIPFIVGLACSEAVEFYGIFLVGPDHPTTQMTFLILSILGTIQFVPTFLKTRS
jgi:hypothetical protein